MRAVGIMQHLRQQEQKEQHVCMDLWANLSFNPHSNHRQTPAAPQEMRSHPC